MSKYETINRAACPPNSCNRLVAGGIRGVSVAGEPVSQARERGHSCPRNVGQASLRRRSSRCILRLGVAQPFTTGTGVSPLPALRAHGARSSIPLPPTDFAMNAGERRVSACAKSDTLLTLCFKWECEDSRCTFGDCCLPLLDRNRNVSAGVIAEFEPWGATTGHSKAGHQCCHQDQSCFHFSLVANVRGHQHPELKANGCWIALLGNSLSLFFRVVEGFGDSSIGRSGAAHFSPPRHSSRCG